VVARSTAEVEYRTMAHGVSEGLWQRRLLLELGLFEDKLIMLYYDNKTAINIANNPIQHDRLNIWKLIDISLRINSTRALCICLLLGPNNKLQMSSQRG
jgi:hypothetical protein